MAFNWLKKHFGKPGATAPETAAPEENITPPEEAAVVAEQPVPAPPAAAAAAPLGEAGYNVLNFCYQDSPRRAHSIAAQGGINAAKNYRNDNDSTYRLFYDTVKGGDYRARETNVYRFGGK